MLCQQVAPLGPRCRVARYVELADAAVVAALVLVLDEIDDGGAGKPDVGAGPVGPDERDHPEAGRLGVHRLMGALAGRLVANTPVTLLRLRPRALCRSE